jgi:hypothetical protein
LSQTAKRSFSRVRSRSRSSQSSALSLRACSVVALFRSHPDPRPLSAGNCSLKSATSSSRRSPVTRVTLRFARRWSGGRKTCVSGAAPVARPWQESLPPNRPFGLLTGRLSPHANGAASPPSLCWSRQVIAQAVSRMLPKNGLRQKRLARLKVFQGTEHPYGPNIVKRYDLDPSGKWSGQGEIPATGEDSSAWEFARKRDQPLK